MRGLPPAAATTTIRRYLSTNGTSWPCDLLEEVHEEIRVDAVVAAGAAQAVFYWATMSVADRSRRVVEFGAGGKLPAAGRTLKANQRDLLLRYLDGDLPAGIPLFDYDGWYAAGLWREIARPARRAMTHAEC